MAERREREPEREEIKKEWYKGGYKSVIFVPATPSSELKAKIQKEAEKQRLLQRSDPPAEK